MISYIRTKAYFSNTSHGFTLVEMIVAVFVFSVVMLAATGALLSILSANRKAQATKSVIDNLNFALESMTRTIRVGNTYHCGPAGGGFDVPKNCLNDAGARDHFAFTSVDGDIIHYKLIGTTLERAVNSNNDADYSPLTAPEIEIEELSFYVDGAEVDDGSQPRVLIVIRGLANADERTQVDFNVQTLVTQRFVQRETL